jgi:hypothetical protein
LAVAVRETAAAAGATFEVDNLTLVQQSSSGPRQVALWHMDETSGPMTDSGLAPANNGALSASGITRGAAGVSGTAYSFTHGWVTVPDDLSLDPGTATVTVSLQLNPAALPTKGDYDIIRKGDYPAQLYKVELLQSGAVFCQFRGSSGAGSVTSTTTIVPNTGFHAVECDRTSTGLKVSVDGAVTTKSANIGAISNSAPVVIGAHTGGNSDFYNGMMDEVAITFGQ